MHAQQREAVLRGAGHVRAGVPRRACGSWRRACRVARRAPRAVPIPARRIVTSGIRAAAERASRTRCQTRAPSCCGQSAGGPGGCHRVIRPTGRAWCRVFAIQFSIGVEQLAVPTSRSCGSASRNSPQYVQTVPRSAGASRSRCFSCASRSRATSAEYSLGAIAPGRSSACAVPVGRMIRSSDSSACLPAMVARRRVRRHHLLCGGDACSSPVAPDAQQATRAVVGVLAVIRQGVDAGGE